MQNKLLDYILSPENTFFKMAKDARRLPHFLISPFLLIVFIFLGALSYEILNERVIQRTFENVSEPIRFSYELIGSFSLILFYLIVWIKLYENRSIITIGITKVNALRNYINGFAGGLIAISIIIGLLGILGFVNNEHNNDVETGMKSIEYVLLILTAFIIQGGVEEITMRGWLLQVIVVKHKPLTGILISFLFFAGLHSLNNNVTILGIFNLFLFAMLLTLFVLLDGNIWRACGWHSAWNWSMGSVYGLEVSGTKESASLLNLKLSGSEFITGGRFGPEGSILTTSVLVIAIFLFWVKRSRSLTCYDVDGRNR